MPTLGEMVYFNENDYLTRIRNQSFSYAQLAKGIYRKRANRLSAKVRFVAGVLASPLTGGLSAVAALASGRTICVESHKLTMLEVEWARRGQQALPPRVVEDKLITIAIAIGTSIFGILIDIGLTANPDILLSPLAYPTIDAYGYAISHHYVHQYAPKAVSQSIDYCGDTVMHAAVDHGTDKYSQRQYTLGPPPPPYLQQDEWNLKRHY